MLFDFDYTIVNRDSFASFVRFLFDQEPWRKVLLLLFSPVLLILSSSKKTMLKRNEMLIWVSTLGMGSKRLDRYQARFTRYFFAEAGAKAYDQALTTLRQHQAQGHHVFIVSGAAQWLLEPICQHLDIHSVTILGTLNKTNLWRPCYRLLLLQTQQSEKARRNRSFRSLSSDQWLFRQCRRYSHVEILPTGSCD